MEALRLALALLLPWAAGVAWVGARWAQAPAGAGPFVLGYGYVAGMLATTLAMRLAEATGLRQSFALTALALALITAAGLRFGRGAPCVPCRGPRFAAPSTAAALVIALLVVRAATLAFEIVWAPLFTWDAWATWAPKARVWFELGRLAPFVSWQGWQAQQPVVAYTLSGHHYPPTVPLIQLWMSLALGRWDDALMNLPWLGCAIALGLGFYGQARLWGAGPLVALTATYALCTLPLFNAHVALAGNADLWMGTVYGFAAMSFLQWRRTRDRRQGLLALGLALACSQVKVPGLVWMLTFVPALVVPRLPRPAIAALAAGAVAGFAALLAGVQELDLPALGRYRLSFEPRVGAAFAESAFALASWHLFWYVWPVLVLIRLRALRRAPAFGAMATLVAQAFLFLGAVYALTPLAAFALDFTQLNRAAMHAVPLLAFVTVVAIVAPPVRAAASSEPSGRT